jgi:hypothetical protein
MEPLSAALFAKIDEQIERTSRLIGLLPVDRLAWQPPMRGAWPAAVLLGHLLECLAGFCAVLYVVEPERLRHFAELRDRPVNHVCGKDEARGRLNEYRGHIHEGFEVLRDTELGRPVPTIFVPGGEAILTLLLGNLEHLINHKHQLFTYLRLLNVDVSSADLYRFRE